METGTASGNGGVHPLESMVAALRELVSEGISAPAWTLTPSQLASLLPELHAEIGQLLAIESGMLREADRQQVGDPAGFANTVGWWSQVTRATKASARRELKLAEHLDADAHQAVRAAALDGAVSLEQAAVIIRAVEDLPDDLVEPALKAKAENHLIEFAADLDPKQLRIVGRRILDIEAPEIAEQALARQLEAEEAHAEATSYFRIHPDGHGSMLGQFKVPLLAGRILEKHLEAIAAPKHQNATAALDPTGQKTPKPWRLGTAFTEYIETRPAGSVPKTGGIAATLVVTMTLEALLGKAQAATLLETGEAISPSQVRRLLCRADIIPAVLGGTSEVLDLGRARRLHTPAQRLAIALRDKTCIVEGCDRSLSHAHIHHLDPWSHGGSTSVERGALICGPHHAQIHNPRYTTQTRPGGKIRFTRRT